MVDVRLPGNAIDSDGADIAAPAAGVLRELNLLPSGPDLEAAGKIGAVWGGPPQSVALIEANATALSKVWATGLGGAVAAGWGLLANFWNDLAPSGAGAAELAASQRTFMLAVGIASAALILSIGYILGSDIRGRSAAAAATIRARSDVADAVIKRAQGRPSDGTGVAVMITPIQPRSVKYVTRPSDDDTGWVAIAFRSQKDGSGREYLVLKGNIDAWAKPAELQFLTT